MKVGEVSTWRSLIEKIVQRFPVKRIVLVPDRVLLAIDTLAQRYAMTIT